MLGSELFGASAAAVLFASPHPTRGLCRPPTHPHALTALTLPATTIHVTEGLVSDVWSSYPLRTTALVAPANGALSATETAAHSTNPKAALPAMLLQEDEVSGSD